MGSDRAGKSVLRTREQALVLAQEVLKRAQGGEDLGRLANEYSDEPNAGSRGGSLGRFTRGQMVAQFDAVAFKLRLGQISGIVETPFGFHIIQRTE
jgi:NIMA-interacting peptidyl-prolyl cis-trans isomerase 1